MLKNLREPKLREMLDSTRQELQRYPDDINLNAQRRAIEEEIAYIQHFGNSRKRRGYR